MKDCVQKESPDKQIVVDGNIFTYVYRLQYGLTLLEIVSTNFACLQTDKNCAFLVLSR